MCLQFLAAKKREAEADTTAWEREIDQRVYPLYGLTPEEIAVVGSGRHSPRRCANTAKTTT